MKEKESRKFASVERREKLSHAVEYAKHTQRLIFKPLSSSHRALVGFSPVPLKENVA